MSSNLWLNTWIGFKRRPNQEPRPTQAGGGRMESNTHELDHMRANADPGGCHSLQKWAQLQNQERIFQPFLPGEQGPDPGGMGAAFGRHPLDTLDPYQFTTAFCEMGVGLDGDDFMQHLFHGSLSFPPHMENIPQPLPQHVEGEAKAIPGVVREAASQAQLAIHASTSARSHLEQMESKVRG